MTALADLFSGLSRWRLWSMLASDDWRNRYHRTLLGPVWILLSFGLFIAVKIVVFQNMSTADARYYSAYLTVGFLAWMFIQQSLNEGAMAFVRNKNWILGVRAPYSIHIFALSWTQLLNLLFNFSATLLIVHFAYELHPQNILPAMAGLFLLLIVFFWVQFILAILGVFFRDLIQFVQTFTRMMLFLTPIFWMPEQFPEPPVFYTYNPFTYCLNLIRDLLFTGMAQPINLIVVSGIGVVAMISTLLLLQLTSRRIPAHI